MTARASALAPALPPVRPGDILEGSDRPWWPAALWAAALASTFAALGDGVFWVALLLLAFPGLRDWRRGTWPFWLVWIVAVVLGIVYQLPPAVGGVACAALALLWHVRRRAGRRGGVPVLTRLMEGGVGLAALAIGLGIAGIALRDVPGLLQSGDRPPARFDSPTALAAASPPPGTRLQLEGRARCALVLRGTSRVGFDCQRLYWRDPSTTRGLAAARLDAEAVAASASGPGEPRAHERAWALGRAMTAEPGYSDAGALQLERLTWSNATWPGGFDLPEAFERPRLGELTGTAALERVRAQAGAGEPFVLTGRLVHTWTSPLGDKRYLIDPRPSAMRPEALLWWAAGVPMGAALLAWQLWCLRGRIPMARWPS